MLLTNQNKFFYFFFIALSCTLCVNVPYIDAQESLKQQTSKELPYLTPYTSLPKQALYVNHHKLNAYIAATPKSRSQGLMFVRSMPKDHAMLFVFEKSDYHSFWMKNTLIPLDIMWLDDSFNVVYIHRNAATEDLSPITPDKKALYVLEINGGLALELGININSQFHLNQMI